MLPDLIAATDIHLTDKQRAVDVGVIGLGTTVSIGCSIGPYRFGVLRI